MSSRSLRNTHALEHVPRLPAPLLQRVFRSADFSTDSAPSADAAWTVSRTKSGQLPVYSDFRNGRSKRTTILRRIRGDVTILEKELSRVCGGEAVARKMGRLEVKGNHTAAVREWLTGLGL